MYGNPYYNQPMRFQPNTISTQPIQPITTPQYIPNIQQPTNSIGLLGKSVDSIEVVKATDIPLDGSISYFPLTDGSAIITKQLQNDGTSRTIIYKPIIEEPKKKDIDINIDDFVSIDDFIELKNDFDDLKNEIRKLKETKKEPTKKESK